MLDRLSDLPTIEEAQLAMEALDGIPEGVWGALRGLACPGVVADGKGGDFVLLGDEFGVLLGDDWWF